VQKWREMEDMWRMSRGCLIDIIAPVALPLLLEFVSFSLISYRIEATKDAVWDRSKTVRAGM